MTAAVKQKRKNGKGNLNSFIFFLILATLFWVLTKFSKEYEQDLVAQLEFVNLPEDAVIGSDADSQLPLRMETSGFEFLYYKLRKPVLSIDVSQLSPDENSQWSLPKSTLEAQATAQFNHPVRILRTEDEIRLPLQALASKKVAVIPAVDYSFKEGYSSLDSFQIEPDSVLLIGPEAQLKSINSINTEAIEFNNLEEDISGELNIALPDGDSQLKVSPQKVSYKMQIQEFIENELTVPITLVGNDEELGIQLFPSSVKVRYTINFAQYKNVQASDFKVICDLSKAAEGSNLLSPELVNFPEGAQNLSLSPKEVEFILIQ